MANLFQVWDEDIQALGAAKASDDQIEARRQQLAEHFKAKAKAAGLSSKKIYETLDQFDAYSRQNSTNEDNRLSPEEEEMAQRVKDGTVTTGAIKEVGKRFKDIGLGALSSLTRMGGDIAQTINDVSDNDKTTLSGQAAQGLYNITDDIRSNYSQGTKTAKKDFWSPEGLTMGVAENLGQIAGTAALLGTGGALAGAAGVTSKAGKLLAMGTMAAPLAYSQGYGQGKESSLDEINKTSNAQLWENVKAEAKAYDDAGGTGEVPYLVSMFKEAGGDLNLMKDLMAENAGNVTGLMTVGTEPLAMGVGSLMSRGAAAGGTGVMAKFANAMNNQGMSNELARRIAAGGKAAIASQAGKIAATQMAREGTQETVQEGLEAYYAKGEGSRAAGRKGELTSEDWRGEDGIIQQGLQGAAIGALMAGGSVYSSARNASKLALEKNGLPEKHDAAIIAHKQAIANLEKATQILDLNPEDVKAQEVHAKAYDEALVATNNLEQLTGKFNALYTPEEQEVIKAKTMEGVAARAKVAEDAAKAQQELDAAQAKAAQEQQAQQNEIIKAQRDEAISRLVPILGDDVAVSDELASMGLSDEEANSLLIDANKEAKAQKKAQKKAGQQNQSAPKTPFELAVEEAFDVNGNRNKVASQDIADKHGIKNIKTLIDAISERIDSNATKTKESTNAELARKRQEARQQAEVLSEKQQLENTLADFARNNDHDSMVNFLRDYDPKEADTLIANAYKAVDKETKAAQDAVTANQKAEALKAKQAEDKKSAEQKRPAFTKDLADLHATNPNVTMAELNAIGKKHGIKSPSELIKAWARVKHEASTTPKNKETLALPSPDTVMVADAQGNVIPTTENNVPKKPRSNDFSVPSGLKVDVSNVENTRSDLGKGSYIGSAMIVRQDGQPFPTEQVAQQALENKATKKPRRKNEPAVSKDTHSVVPVDGGFAIAPVVEVEQPKKKPDDNEDGGVIADAPKPNAPVSPTGQQAVDNTPTQSIEGEYQHNKIESVKATVTKTDKGYDVNWGDEVQSFTGKNAADKTQAALKKEGFSKKKPDNDNGGVAVEPVEQVEPIVEIKQPKQANKTVNTENDDLLTAIAKLGGLSREESVKKFGIDPSQTNIRKAGLLPVFRKDTGLSFDDMAKTLHGYGYPVSDNGEYSPNALYEALDDALRGREIGTSDYYEKQMEQKYAERMREEAEFYDAISKAGSSTWEEADNIEAVADAMVTEITNNNSTISKDLMASTLKEVENVSDSTSSRQDNDTTAKTQSIENSNAKVASSGERGQQESQRDSVKTTQSQGLQGLTLTSQTEASRKQEEDAIKAAETKRLAEEKAAKDKAQADKELNDFRLTGSNAPADIAMAGGQKDMFAAPTRGEREAEKAKQETTKEEPVKWFDSLPKAVEWVAKQKGQKFDIRQSNGRFEIYPAKEQAQDKSVQNNAPTKQPEAKTEPKAKVDFSEASVKLEDVLNKWEAIKKGDIVVTKSGRALIAQSDAKGKMSIRFKAREGGLEEALSIVRVTGDNKVSKMLSDRLQEQSKGVLAKRLIGKNTEGNNVYEDANGIRFVDNGGAFLVGESVGINIGNKQNPYDTSARTDEHRTVEEVAARQPNPQPKEEKPAPTKEPSKKENRLIEIDSDIDAAAIENLYDLALGAAKATQIKADRDKNKPVDFAANTFEDKWQKAINGDAKAIKDIRDYFVNNKRVPNMTKAHLIIFEGLTNQDFTSKTYEYVASKFDEYINGFSDARARDGSPSTIKTDEEMKADWLAKNNIKIDDEKTEQQSTSEPKKAIPTFDDVMTHLKGIHKLSSELFKDAQSKAVIKNTLEDYLDKVMPNDVSAKDFKAITDKFFNELVSSYPQTEHQSSGMLAHPIPEIAKQTNQPTKKENLLIKIDDELDAALDDLANVFKEQGKRLSSGVDPVILGKVLVFGAKASSLYIAKGAVKFAVWAENMINGLSSKGVQADVVKPYLKQMYLAAKVNISPEIRKQMDKEDDVYDFDFAILNESSPQQDTQNVTTPSQTNGTNARERNQTPESSQVQRASESGLTQDNSEKRDDGVSTNSGGREVTGDRGNNNSGQSSVRGNANGKSTSNQSSVLPSGTRSTESSDGTNLRNYRIQPNELKRTGSWRATAEQNVQIVELVKTIIAENRAATPEEKTLLTKFTGWGASEIANGIFPNQYGSYKDASWKALGERLEAALTPEEYAQAKRTTQYAHYTSEPIIRSVYAALSRFGFNGGSLVEPGMGVGLFNGLMPDAMANNSQYTGIEYDTITGNIAKLLYPDSNIIVGDFTETKLPKNFFDVAIGNPPFGSIKIQSDPEYKKQGFLLHDYFFAKTIDRVKEGGLLVFVTSKGTMDKANDRARKYLSERADLVGAIRLPQTAFKDNAGTEVVTDVIFLRKRMAGQEPAGEAWAGLKEITTPQGATSINEYFATHPEMILGKSALTGSMYRANEYTVEPIAGSDIETLFSEAINNLPENIYTPQRGSKAEQAAVQRRDYDPKIKKEGGIYVADDGVLMQVNNGQGTPLTKKQNSKHELVDLSPKEMQWLKDYVGVRDALKQAQYDQLQDNSNWQQSLDALNKTYDAFVKKHGFIEQHTVSERENEDGSTTVTKRFKNHGLLFLDAEGALARTLEDINPDNSISKAPALLGRVINKPSTPVITSTQDAMFVVFNELGRFDLAKVAKLINKSEKDVITELGDSIYEDPSSSWTTADDYLSGNVVRKLKEAEQAARLNPKYQRNVTALKAVQPPALAPQDINVQLGAAWIPASDIGLFASEVLGEQRLKVSYSPLTGQWSVEGTANYSSEWGIPAKDSQDILEAVLNNRQIKVTYTDENKKTHTDTEKTEKANDIAKKMRESFKRWLWQDVPRTERLVTYYNEHFNNIAPRSFDGQHLTLPGVSSRFDLRPHQKRAIWRTIQQGDVYYAHAVGAGKTFTMIASGMEERRLGLVKKPMYVVPNHMLAQFSKEFLELYPMANIMVADEANFHTHNRRKFVAQAALNNPDAIVITHSAFGRIGMSSDYSYKFIKNQIADWQEALQEVGNDERITRKQIERRIEQLENKLKALLDGAKDQLLNFEELGVDRLYVDEGHEFRKLDFPTNRGNIKGIDPSGSQKSMDLYMKVEYLRSKNPNRSLVMASGTPVTNTMGELFTVQRFFNPSQLEEDGDSRFDAWSAHYGEVVDGLEQNAAGGYEAVSRFAKFVNVPELMTRVRYFMDILTSNQLKDLVTVPKIKDGGQKVVVTPTPDGYKEYQKDLEKRIKAIRNRKAPPKAGDDIILNVITDGRFSAIDMRFIDSTLPSDPNSKLNRMLDDLISVYHETSNNEYVTSGVIDENKGSSIIVFTNIGLGEQSAKNRGFDMKAWIEKRLVEGGVKREHIAFMRDNKAHSKKEKLFDDIRKGKKRILIGGKDMETGVNAQKRLTHLFHLDSVWFPATVEQREGRIIRQGNQNKIVDIRRYVTKGSYDSTMWSTVSRKMRFIEQAMSGDSSVRSMEDVSEASAFEMAAALASGDERYLKLAGLKGDVERLGRLYSAHIDEQKRFAREKSHLESSNKRSASKIEQINAAIAQRKPIKAGEFLANVGKNTFDNRDEFSKALFEKFKQVAESYKADEIELGSIAGFPIVYNGVELRGGNFAADLRVDLPINVEPLAIFPIDPAYSITGIATRAVNQTNALDRELISRKNTIEQNTKDLARINRRIGASFPEMAELNEKQQALNELEQELNAEGNADDDLSQTDNQDTDNKPKFSQSSTIGDRTITQVRDKLISRFGKRIIDLLESKGILKIHQSMSDKDIPAEALRQLAFHGSPHKFDKFSLEHLGSGEGAQVYGWGLYFASKKAVSEWYREQLASYDYYIGENKVRPTSDVGKFLESLNKTKSNFNKQKAEFMEVVDKKIKSQSFGLDTIYEKIAEYDKKINDPSETRKGFFGDKKGELETQLNRLDLYKKEKEMLESATKENTRVEKGQLYKVNIPEDNTMLLWDSWTNTQSDDVIKGLLSASNDNAISEEMRNDLKRIVDKGIWTGKSIYKELKREFNSDKKASLFLKKHGINGIKYLDGSSRFAGEGTYNYVVFDDSAVEILKTYYSAQQGVTEGFYFNGTVHLIADNLTDETIIPTFVHELGGHKGFQQMMSPTAYQSLMRQFNRLVKQGNAIALEAKARAEAAEVVTPTADTKEAIALAEKQTLQRQQDELLPYLLTLQATLNATRSQQSAVTKVIEQVYRAVKAWLYRTLSAKGYDGLASKLLQPKDITLLAERMIREMGNETNPSNKTNPDIRFSRLNTPQTQINAVRRKYEGTDQWMKAPNGQPTKLNEMQWLQVRTPNFKAWFGDWENDPANASKVVDENGEPMVVYHGSRKTDISEFHTWTAGIFGAGTYFTIRKHEAHGYSNNGKVYEAYINARKPLRVSEKAFDQNYFRPASQDDVIRLGYDSTITTKGKNHDIDYVIAINPTQIKSAMGNNGEFNPTNPDIRFSRKAKNPITEGIKSAANDAKNSLPKPISGKIDHFLAGRRLPSSDMANITAKTELSLYHRTISTQQNTALQNADFKKVYDMAQRYLQHVAVDAYAALQVAPNLLGKLESWSDLKKEFKKAWPATYIKQKTDRAAVAAVIFDETLNNELRSEEDILKSLSRDQRKIYKEARDAIEVSLKNTAKSEMVRKLLAAEAINWHTVESLMDKNLPVEQFAQSVRDLVESRIGGLNNELESILDSDKMVKKAFKTGKVLDKDVLSKAQRAELKQALFLKEQIDTTKEALKSLNDVEKRLDTLLEQGYAPLMRFGEYTLTVKDLDGKVKSFFMFESKAEQVRATNAIVERYGKTVKLETDMISKEEFKQFAGMTPETMALFARETGMDKDAAYQHYLKLAIPARSAMTRMIKRKGTAGFSDDIQRVVASFVMSNARMSAKNIYAAQIEKSIQDIESGKSVKDQAYVMKENVFNPKENFAQLRNILFLWNLGGSIFFGLLNMTQPYMQTLPHLSQYVPIKEAFDAIIKGSGIAGSAMKNGTAPKGYEAEYNRAVREGVVDPQNVFMLSGVERGKTGASNSAWGVITHTMGLIAQVTESFNRKAVFIAALEVANKKGAVWLKKKGFNSAYDFAKDTVDQTQGVYNKANRSNWANTSVGAPLMVFKQFSINYVEQMVRMWKKEAASGDEGKKAVFLMLAMLASLSGMMGLPFIKDILDVSETTAAFLGNPVNIEREARLALGKDLADPLFNGVLNHFVFNNLGMDIQSRTGMPDLVPWSNALNPTLSAQGRVNEFASIAGATGGLIEKGYDASQFIARGNVGMAALTLLPRSVTSLITGGKMAATDEVTDSKGNKLFDTTWDEGLVKAIDATPKRMADLSRTKSLEWKDFAIQDYMTTSFKQKLINAMMDKDQAEVNKLMKEIDVWNNARSRYPVYIDLNTLAENANKKDQTFDAREKIRKGMTWVKDERPEM